MRSLWQALKLLFYRGNSGQRAERIAECHLKRAGLKIVARNYRCKCGEIDLIARQGELLVFVEVRLRQHRQFGGAALSVDRRKQRRLIRTAEHYLQRLTGEPPPCRFDIVALSSERELEWLINAFDAQPSTTNF